MIILKWILNRPIYLKKEIISFWESIVYQKQSCFLLHNWNAHRCPYQAILFYSFFGRVLFASKELIALLSKGKILKKSLYLDGFDKDIPINSLEGHHDRLYPQSPFIDIAEIVVDDSYFDKMKNSLDLAQKNYHDNLDKTKDWEIVSKKFQVLLLDESGNLKKDTLINFRKNHNFESVIADTFKQVDTRESYIKEYLKGIDVVLEFHRTAKKVSKEILASLSESYAGNSTCVHYRGQRISEKLLFYAIVTEDITSNVIFTKEHRNVILDIGTGYGALPTILSHYIPNSCQVLTDLPEVIIFASYYIKYNFPDKKIALLEDIIDRMDDFDVLTKEYDFIILPSKAIERIPKSSIDLVVNTASLGFLSQEYLDYYIKHIDRVLKKDAYLYSINKTDTCKWGIGMYQWELKQKYLTVLLEFNNRFSYPQWLGKKLN